VAPETSPKVEAEARASGITPGASEPSSGLDALERADEPAPPEPSFAKALVFAGIAAALAGFWFVGLLLSGGVYRVWVRPRLKRPRGTDVCLVVALALALGVGHALSEHAKTARARTELAALAGHVEAFRAHTGKHPESLTALGWRLFEALPDGNLTDPWGRAYALRAGRPGTPAVLASQGADPDSESDDLRVPLGGAHAAR
ncbi:MAG TPA: type II secretion system protein GspG, partial [Polyangiaceae bacterium]|nr:type II secretion system protein GspG [Polyangiaceae bacterium]